MILKIIGLALTVGSCGVMGFKIAAAYLNEISILKKIINTLDIMECELQYRLTPLPDLCKMVADDNKGILADVFNQLASALENQISPDVDQCMSEVLVNIEGIPPTSVKILQQLGKNLGRFDMEGQIRGIDSVREEGKITLEQLSKNQNERIRDLKTLGVCAGAAIAILLI